MKRAPVNENKESFTCGCGKKLSSKKILQRHKKFVHADVKIFFQCQICDLKFSRKDKLKIHQKQPCVKANIDENLEKKKPFVCECGKRFSDKKGLQRHENSAHAAVKKTIKCEFCEVTLSRKYKLKTHLDKHCKGKR